MRERERCAEKRRKEKDQETERLFELIKKGARVIFSHSNLRRNLGYALFFEGPDISEEKRAALFEDMVNTNAEYCLSGDPEVGGTAKDHCDRLIEKVDFWPHARDALVRALELYTQAGKSMPDSLRKWSENQGEPPPKKRGQSYVYQHWKAMRDQVICLAIDWAVTLQEDSRSLGSVDI